MTTLRRIILALLATAGIRIDELNNSRILAVLLIIVGYGCHFFLTQYISVPIAFTYFAVLFIARYALLFGSFFEHGLADTLTVKFGEARGWKIYELLTSVLFFQRGLSFGLLAEATSGTMELAVGGFFHWDNTQIQTCSVCLKVLGVLLTAIGLWINVAATFVIGIDTYYYKDLFLRRALGEFKVAGPYKYFSNPMYGIGQASGYGAALFAGSIPAFLATLLNQIVMYVFYVLVEKPHIRSILNREETIGNTVGA